MDKLLLSKRDEAESAAKDPLSKLASKKDGPFWVLIVYGHILKADFEGIHIAVSISRVILARTHQEPKAAISISRGNPDVGKADLESRTPSDSEDGDHSHEYTMEKLVAYRESSAAAYYWMDGIATRRRMSHATLPSTFRTTSSRCIESTSDEQRSAVTALDTITTSGQTWELIFTQVAEFEVKLLSTTTPINKNLLYTAKRMQNLWNFLP